MKQQHKATSTKKIITKSGIKGYQCKLQDNYSNFEEFTSYDETYNLAARLGFVTTMSAWNTNPTIQGSTNPEDFCIAPQPEAPECDKNYTVDWSNRGKYYFIEREHGGELLTEIILDGSEKAAHTVCNLLKQNQQQEKDIQLLRRSLHRIIGNITDDYKTVWSKLEDGLSDDDIEDLQAEIDLANEALKQTEQS